MRHYVLAALPALFFAVTVQAADFTETKLAPGDATEGDNFGSSVAISGTTVMVGASLKNYYQGVVYLFDATAGTQTVKFDANGAPKKGLLGSAESIFSSIVGDGAAWDQFGKSVAISGTTAIVGAMGSKQSSNYPGAAYLFDTATGAQMAKLTADDGVAADFFGSSVAVSGATAVVGAMGKGNKQGAAYLFDTTTGKQTAKLTASDAADGDLFGIAAALSDTTAIVGAMGKDSKKGAAYLFDIATGKQTAKLTASDAADGDAFGISVAISGTTAIIAAVGSDSSQGAAYLFDTTTGKQTAKLTASDAAKSQQFGSSVAVIGTTAVVGANGFNLDGGGAAYQFDTTTGKQTAKLSPSDAVRGNQFGSSVAISDSTILVGASNSDVNRARSGAAYLFHRK